MPLTPANFDFVRMLVRQRAAIVLAPDKAYLAETRLSSLAWQEGLSSVDHLLARLRSGPDDGLQRKVVEAMTTNETSFFRDLHPFEALRQTVLPELVQRRPAAVGLHLWSAACASGQEPYSLAMLVHEHFPTLAAGRLRIIASDLSTEMLDRARQGVYSQMEVNRGLPARLLVKYFQKHGQDWQIKDDVRRLVEFRPINLVGAWPALPALDVVLLRNVLIYFDVATKKQILGKVRQLLRPDGCLILGGAETTINLDDAFERVTAGRSGYYRLRQG
jgi:chemotaxis protein methyltransferase CheR